MEQEKSIIELLQKYNDIFSESHFGSHNFVRVWQDALPYQDKRNDKGHAEIATRYVIEMLSIFNFWHASPLTVLPAIILHDIGWSQMPEDKMLIAYNPPSEEAEYTARLEHQIFALELANMILDKAGWSGIGQSKGEILVIISQHDTRKGFYTLDDAIVRDADKLWRYTQRHMDVTCKNKGWTQKSQAQELLNKLAGQIDDPEFFMTPLARDLARRDIKTIKIPDWLE